jgi:hypothetical protein
VKTSGEIVCLNIQDLDVVELQERLEMAVAFVAQGECNTFAACSCIMLSNCQTFCF